MSLYAVHLANGRTSNTGVFRLLGRLLSGTGVIESTGFTVSAQGTPDMTVKVSGSTVSDNVVIVTATGDTYHGWNTANANVTIAANATGVSKRDAVVVYVDTALTTTTADNPTGLVLTTVRGSGVDVIPTDSEINTAVAGKPWMRLANIFVGNGATSINSGNITDVRTFSGIGTNGIAANAVSQSASTQTFIDSAADDGATQSITSGAWNDVTNLTQTLTTTGGDIDVAFSMPVDNTSSAGTSLFRIVVDSAAKGKTSQAPGNTTSRHTVTWAGTIKGISAGSHTVKVQAQMLAGGGATLRMFVGQSSYSVREVKR